MSESEVSSTSNASVHRRARAMARPRAHWTNDQTLYFLRLLQIAKRRCILDISRSIATKRALKACIPAMQKKFPSQPWSFRKVWEEFRRLREYWRVFRDAASLQGSEYDDETGQLTMDPAERSIARDGHPLGLQVVREGLLIDDHTNFDHYAQIFTEDLPQSIMIADTVPDAYIKRSRDRDDALENRLAKRRRVNSDADSNWDSEAEEAVVSTAAATSMQLLTLIWLMAENLRREDGTTGQQNTGPTRLEESAGNRELRDDAESRKAESGAENVRRFREWLLKHQQNSAAWHARRNTRAQADRFAKELDIKDLIPRGQAKVVEVNDA